MHQIKQLPEDFVVKEISYADAQVNGQYAYYILKKINLSTTDALQILSEKFKIPLKNFGFAGNKDKNAVTEQKISIFKGSKKLEDAKLKDIQLKYLGNGKTPISLGDLDGNEFFITIRNLNISDIKKIKKLETKKIMVPNFFGAQRFSKNNHLVGKEIAKRDFKKAIELISENKGVVEDKIKKYLEKNKNNYIGALRLITLKTRKLFVHSYQSYLFNKIVDEYLKENGKNNDKILNIKIPIIGFNFELNTIKNKKLKDIIKNILDEEKINSRDFIISQMPELTSEGGFRNLFFELNFRILESGQDELSKSKQRVKLNFVLPKSCYATTALEFMIKSFNKN